MPAPRGESAIVVPVPAVEPVVSDWRRRFDSSAAAGMPAHITVLYPFLPVRRLDPSVLAQLRGCCATFPIQHVAFRQTARFPGVLYLAPEPARGFQELTAALVERWPEAPPYGGTFDEVIPHLTVAHGVGEDVLADVASDLQVRLPLHARLREAVLFVLDGERWQPQARLPFGADR